MALVVMATRRALHFVFKVGNRFQTAHFFRDVLGMKVQTRARGAGALGVRGAEPHLGVRPKPRPSRLAPPGLQLQEALLGLRGLLSVADDVPTHVLSFKFIPKRALRCGPCGAPSLAGKTGLKSQLTVTQVPGLEPFGLDRPQGQSPVSPRGVGMFSFGHSVSGWILPPSSQQPRGPREVKPLLPSNIQHLSAALGSYAPAGSLGDTQVEAVGELLISKDLRSSRCSVM